MHMATDSRNTLRGHVAVCTILRNAADSLPDLRVAFDAIGALFERHTFLVVESGSTDGTRRALRQWHRDDPAHVELILPTSGKPHHGYWRNRYLEVVLREPLRFAYMVAVDGDMPWLKEPAAGLAGLRDSLFNHGGLQWAAMVANGQNPYDGALYDTFAFRNEQFRWSPQTGDWFCSEWSLAAGRCASWSPMVRNSRPDRFGEASVPHATNGQTIWFQAKDRFELRIPTTLPPLRVQSYFGGLGVYKVEYLRGCEYCQVKCTAAERQINRSRLLCEHVPLHDCMWRTNRGAVYINPKMVVAWHHHSSHEQKRQCMGECERQRAAEGAPGSRRRLSAAAAAPFRRKMRPGWPHLTKAQAVQRGRGGRGRGRERGCRCPRLFSNGTRDARGEEVVFMPEALQPSLGA